MEEYENLGHMSPCDSLPEDKGSNYHLASNTVLNNFYIDDCISGADTEAEELYIQLNGLLSAGGLS